MRLRISTVWTFLVGAVILAGGWGLASSAQALTCDQYVQAAVDNANANDRFECFFTGPRWTKDAKAHKDFCEGNQKAGKMAIVLAEHQGRINDLNACGSACEPYADSATSRATDAQTKHCPGLTGPRYTTNRNEHLTFCMNNKRAHNFAIIWSEQEARNSALDKCFHSNP
jgi:hypothetical protein